MHQSHHCISGHFLFDLLDLRHIRKNNESICHGYFLSYALLDISQLLYSVHGHVVGAGYADLSASSSFKNSYRFQYSWVSLGLVGFDF